MSMDDFQIQNGLISSDRFNFFDRHRINEELLVTRPFIDALHIVESTIANPHLSVKFGQTCLVKLRNQPIYDLRKCRRYVTEIFTHLVKVCQSINFEVDQLTDEWSNFVLCHRTQSTFDRITFDKATIIGAQINSSGNDDDKFGRTIFFFYTKILHELAHASIAELGRRMPIEEDDQQFMSPATHALTGEAGNAVERHFFGSVIDAIGHYTDSTRMMYEIDHLILREKQRNLFIKADYLRRFRSLNFCVLTEIPYPETEHRNVKLKINVSSRHRWSDSKRRCTNELGLSPKSAILCRFQRMSPDSIKEPRKLDIDDDSDGEQSLFSSNGKFEYSAILKKSSSKHC